MELNQWIEENKLNCEFINKTVFKIKDVGQFLILSPKENVFDSSMQLQLTEVEQQIALHCDYLVYKFGGEFYYTSTTSEKVDFKPFKYLGKAKQELNTGFPFLGIHSGYEVLNGSRLYEDWCRKVKFLGSESIGIAEKNTLGGAIAFQLAAEKSELKPVFGETITIKRDEAFIYDAKVYVVNENGWSNLLLINKEINVVNEGFIDESLFATLGSGIILVYTHSNQLNKKILTNFKDSFHKVLYQFDPVEFKSDTKDEDNLKQLNYYLKYFYDIIDPVLVHDAYYMDKEDSEIKIILNKIKVGASHDQSNDQYLKSLDEHFEQLNQFFPESPKHEKYDIYSLFEKLTSNAAFIADTCNFKIELGINKLPQFIITDEIAEEYSVSKDDIEGLFYKLIELFFQNRLAGKENIDVYFQRIEKEVDVIKRGGFINYFLILWDLIRWCEKNDILVGTGRGSAAGSLVAYCLGIVKIDPIFYDLLFERFLNESRISKGLPDIDSDFESEKRENVKEYLRQKYGGDYVTSIGTYNTLKLKGALQDLGKQFGHPHKELTFLTKKIEQDGDKWSDIFEASLGIPLIAEFVKKPRNFDLINKIKLALNQPKSHSIHAAGVVVVPSSKEIYEWMPVRKMGEFLVSEWEGTYLDKVGFLKIDSLGLMQLDKFSMIFKLIKENHNEIVSFDVIEKDLQNEGVFEYFQNGYNEDVFQFQGSGLKGYCQDLKPETIEDLIATVALYRPGPMESGAHIDFIRLKEGLKQPEYDYMMEDITKKTYSLLIYQEQAIQAVQTLGGLSLAEADLVRRAFGKKIHEEVIEWKEKFLQGAKERGCEEYEAIMIWNKLEAFAGYSFNRSHAAAYAIMGYYSQWLKFKYPVEFWTASLQFCKDKEIPARISEMNKMQICTIEPPDINKSGKEFISDFKNAKIYWSLSRIKQLGEITVDLIFEARGKGEFFSLRDFYDKVDNSKVNKRHILHLILAGAFDISANIKDARDRIKLIKEWCDIYKEKELPEEFRNDDFVWKNYWWTLKQKELSGLGYIDFEKIVKSNKVSENKYVDSREFFTEKVKDDYVSIAGVIKSSIERRPKNKNKDPFGTIELDVNDDIIYITCWSNTWGIYKKEITEADNKIMIIDGRVGYDDYKKHNVLYTTDRTKLMII